MDNVSSITEKLGTMKLSDEEAEEVRSLDTSYGDMLRTLGKYENDYTKNKNALIDLIKQAEEYLHKRANTIALKHGIDLSSGKWVLDLPTATFIQKTG